MLQHLDAIMPQLEGSVTQDEKMALNQYQIDIKRILTEKSSEESKVHEDTPERILQVTTASKTTGHAKKENSRHLTASVEETTSAENIQTLLLQQKVNTANPSMYCVISHQMYVRRICPPWSWRRKGGANTPL
jgi:hypothetical protein